MRCLVLFVVALITGGCAGGEEDLVTREELVAAFEEAGEPLELRADIAGADLGAHIEGLSEIDAMYVPEGTGEGLAVFIVSLMQEADPEAEAAAESGDRAPPDPRLPQLDPVWEKNVVLLAFDVDAGRRERLVAIVESL